MRKVAENLVSKIDKDIDKSDNSEYTVIDIWTLLQCFALDIIGETAFGTSFNMIEDNNHFVPAAINEEMRAGAISALYPFLSKFILKEGGKMNSKLTKVEHIQRTKYRLLIFFRVIIVFGGRHW